MGKVPKWLLPAMGVPTKYEGGESDFKALFDHVIAYGDTVFSFPYGIDSHTAYAFRSFCKVFGYMVRFYKKPSAYFGGTSTVIIYPLYTDGEELPFKYWEHKIVRELNKKFPNKKHEFVLGNELFSCPNFI